MGNGVIREARNYFRGELRRTTLGTRAPIVAAKGSFLSMTMAVAVKQRRFAGTSITEVQTFAAAVAVLVPVIVLTITSQAKAGRKVGGHVTTKVEGAVAIT